MDPLWKKTSFSFEKFVLIFLGSVPEITMMYRKNRVLTGHFIEMR